MTRRQTVLVVGAGLLGSALGWQLAERGHRVTLVHDPQQISASALSFGWVNAAGRMPEQYRQFRTLGQFRWLQEALRGGADWYHASGTLDWTYGESWSLGPGLQQTESLEEAYQRRLGEGQDVSVVSAVAALQLEPALSPSALSNGALFARDEGWIDVPSFLEFAQRKLRAHGGRVLEGQVERIIRQGRDVIGVALKDDGVPVTADLTIIAAGGETSDLLAPLGLPLPTASNAGVTIHTEPLTSIPKLVLRGTGTGIRPLSGNRLLVHDARLEKLYAETGQLLGPEIVAALSRAESILRLDEPLRVERVLAGTRPIPADGMPVVGEFAGIDGLGVLFSHSGATLALILAELFAAEITEPNFHHPLLAGYRPERFTEEGDN